MDVIERKVCIVCTGRFAYTIDECHVFVVDLRWFSDDSDVYELLSMSPTVRFDTTQFHLPAFCVLGSTLYVIDGYDRYGDSDGYDDSDRYDDSNNPGGGKSTLYTYQLSPGISNLKLDKDMLSEGPAMNGDKVSPQAIVAPNGMILVFSRVIYVPQPNECDFELYDPVHKKWHKLPSLCPSLDYVSHRNPITCFWIETFTFMEENVFFVKTKVGVFTLDIMARNKVWKINGFCCANAIPPHIGTSLVLIKKDICMIPYTSFGIREYGEPGENEDVFDTLFYQFPDISMFKDNYSNISGGVVLLENRVEESKVFNVCLLHSGLNERTKESELMLQVYSCNLEECRKELHKYRQKKIDEHPNWMEREIDIFDLPATKKTKTYKIVVKPDPEASTRFGFCSFASIPPIEIASSSTEMARTSKRRRRRRSRQQKKKKKKSEG